MILINYIVFVSLLILVFYYSMMWNTLLLVLKSTIQINASGGRWGVGAQSARLAREELSRDYLGEWTLALAMSCLHPVPTNSPLFQRATMPGSRASFRRVGEEDMLHISLQPRKPHRNWHDSSIFIHITNWDVTCEDTTLSFMIHLICHGIKFHH